MEDLNEFLVISSYQWANKMNAFRHLKYIELPQFFWDFYQWLEK